MQLVRYPLQLLDAGFIQLTIALLICAAPGTLYWALTHPDQLSHLVTNRAREPYRDALLLNTLISLGICAIGYLTGLTLLARRSIHPIGIQVRRLNAYLSPILLGYTIPTVASRGIENSLPFYLMVVIGITAFITFKFTSQFSDRFFSRIRPKVAAACLLIITIGYSAYASFLSILNLRYLRVSSFDLALYHNLIWNTSHGHFLESTLVRGGTHMSAHFDPILLILTPFYLLFPQAETLLVFQSTWLALGAIPLFLLAKRVLESDMIALFISACYLAHPAVHGVNLYEFHSLTLVIPLVLWAVYFIERGSLFLYFGTLLLILATREDMALLSCGIGLYIIFGPKRRLAGLITILLACIYLWYVKSYVMYDSALLMSSTSTSYAYGDRFSGMIPDKTGGAKDFAFSLISNPVFALKHALEERKLLFLLQVFGPVLFLPFLASSRRVCLVYGLVFTLLATTRGHFSIYHQYSSVLIPFVFVLTPFGLRRLGSRTKCVAFAVLASSFLISWKFGAFAYNRAFHMSSWRSVHHESPKKLIEYEARYRDLLYVLEQIPDGVSVSATRYILPLVADRQRAYLYPNRASGRFQLVQLSTLNKKELARQNEKIRTKRYVHLAGRGDFVLLMDPSKDP